MRAVVIMIAVAALVPVREAAPGEWHPPVEVAAGAASVGEWRMNESDWRYVDDPTVAVAADGTIGVAWVDQAHKDVFFRRYGADGQPLSESPVNVSKSPEIFSWLPRLVVRNDDIFVLWQEIVFSGGSHGGEAFFARSMDSGATFGAPVNLSNTTHGVGKGRLTEQYWHNGSLDLVAAQDGTLVAAWSEYQGPLRVARSVDGGGSWSDPVLVAGGERALPTRGPSLAYREGSVHLVWTVGEDAAADIHYAVSRDGGRGWSEPHPVAASAAHADAPSVAVDAEGSVHLAWMDSPAGPFREYRILYVRGNPDNADWPEPVAISRRLPGGFDSAGFPSLELDASGNPHVLFELFRGRSQRGTGLALVRSADGGRSFTDPALVPRGGPEAAGVNGSLQGLLTDKLAVSPNGSLVVVNSTIDRGTASQVWLLRTER